FMCRTAVTAQQVDLGFVGARKLASVTHTNHLRATRLSAARCRRLAGNVSNIFRLLGICDIDNRRAVVLLFAGERIELRAAMMTDIRDPSVALLVNGRLISAARL